MLIKRTQASAFAGMVAAVAKQKDSGNVVQVQYAHPDGFDVELRWVDSSACHGGVVRVVVSDENVQWQHPECGFVPLDVFKHRYQV
ncbi:hypothetical protein [Achromobacter phage Motura]|uniref:Uncharacterized protein n=1 Tax=Achromobacter phage Motura TaxID=2591403 RepID=A0A514CSJ8_9CAUD|nr:hypothetical protein H1O15_gp044 [Achromobacter phage Motura]QDH83452.1 hypothetical protein [Achromobacter phage Motura]